MNVKDAQKLINDKCVASGYKEISKLYIDNGIDISSGNRWEQGVGHHSKSKELMKHIETLDFVFNDDYFCWKTGGDGDNGESLMYILDMFFELQEKLNDER